MPPACPRNLDALHVTVSGTKVGSIDTVNTLQSGALERGDAVERERAKRHAADVTAELDKLLQASNPITDEFTVVGETDSPARDAAALAGAAFLKPLLSASYSDLLVGSARRPTEATLQLMPVAQNEDSGTAATMAPAKKQATKKKGAKPDLPVRCCLDRARAPSTSRSRAHACVLQGTNVARQLWCTGAFVTVPMALVALKLVTVQQFLATAAYWPGVPLAVSE